MRWRRRGGSASSGATRRGLRASAGDILHRAGRWDEADEVTRAGLDFDEDFSGWIYLQATRALFLAARGERVLAEEALAAARRQASPEIDADVRAYLLQATAEAAVLDDRPVDALSAVEAGLAEFAGSDEQFLLAPLLVAGMTAAADLADHGRAFRSPAEVESAKAAGGGLLEQARGARIRRKRGPGSAIGLGGNRDRRGRVDPARGSVGPGRMARSRRRLVGRPDALPGRPRQGPCRRGDPPRPWPARGGRSSPPRGARSREGARRSAAQGGDRVDRDTVADRRRRAAARRRRARRRGGRPGSGAAGRPRSSGCRPASGRSWSSSRRDGRTRRSPRRCSSAPRPRASTSPTSSTSWASTTASRPRRSRSGSSGGRARPTPARASDGGASLGQLVEAGVVRRHAVVVEQLDQGLGPVVPRVPPGVVPGSVVVRIVRVLAPVRRV